MSFKANDEKFEQALKSMDKKIRDISETVSTNLIPETKEILVGNVYKTILITFLVGLVTGIIMSFIGRRSGKSK